MEFLSDSECTQLKEEINGLILEINYYDYILNKMCFCEETYNLKNNLLEKLISKKAILERDTFFKNYADEIFS